MRLFVLVGVCVLLLAVNTDAAKKKKFWDMWETDGKNDVPGDEGDDGDDKEFTIEGSGVDEGNSKQYVTTYEDDEDFPDYSGDGDGENTGGKVVKETKPTRPSDDEDDDLFEESGSGAGEEEAIVEVPLTKETAGNVVEATPRPKLTACEQLRSSAFDVADYIPECDVFGDFKTMQCTVDIKTKAKSCWCVTTMDGTQIPGTLMHQPEQPDCDHGKNLKDCVHMMVLSGRPANHESNQPMLGANRPRCDLNGDYEPIQCRGSQCYCVDTKGNKVLGTTTDLPNMPNCDAKPVTSKVEPRTKAPVVLPIDPNRGYTVKSEDKNVVVTVSVGDDTQGGENKKGDYAPIEHTKEPILGQPGFLAAIIAGGVITLLLIVLLVMFIVYRMRKKDEGSYPLDEQKYQNYSYAKAPDKEFYA